MKKTLEAINSLVEERVIDGYAIGGAVAAIFYTEPAETGDLDIFITFPEERLIVSLEDIYDALRKKGYAEFHEEGIIIEGIPVQFLPASNALLLEAYANAVTETVAGIETRILSFEHLAAIMLQTNRPKDQIRLALFASDEKMDQQKFQAVLQRHNLSSKWQAFAAKFGPFGNESL